MSERPERRRGKGEGSIAQRADGRWQGRISLGGYGPSRKVKCVYGPTQEAVIKKMRTALVERDNGTPLAAGDTPTLKAFSAVWLETVRPTLKPSSANFYQENLDRHILPTLGARRLTAIQRGTVLSLIRSLRVKGLATTTIRGIVRTLSACLSGAMDEGRIPFNPALSVRRYLRQRDDETHGPDPLSADEARRVVQATKRQFSRWTAFVLCGLRTGLRLSELIGLGWADLHDETATLTVRRAVVKGVTGTPKNHQCRVVDVSPELLRALQVYRRALGAFALKKGRPAPTIMFPAVGGVDRLDESNTRKVFLRICAAAQVRQRSPHDMRDTFASQLLSANAPLLYVSGQLGHSSAAVTLKHYAKWLPKADTRYVQLLDAVCASDCVSEDEAARGNE